MEPDELKAMYGRWLAEVWGAGRMEASEVLLADQIVDHNPYPGQPGGRRGHDWAVTMVRKASPDLRFAPDLVVSDGEYVCDRWTMTGTNTGVFDLFRLPPTGRPVTMTGQEMFRAAGGSS